MNFPDARPTTSLNGEDRRKMKIERFTRQTAMSKAMQNIRVELKRRADDESLMVIFSLTKEFSSSSKYSEAFSIKLIEE